MADALYLKAPAVITIGGTTYSTTSDIVVNQATPNAAIPSQLGGPLGFFVTGREDTITFTPHGVMSSGNLSNLVPLTGLPPGSKVFSDQPCTIVDVNGNTYTWYNAAITGQPVIDLNIDAPTCFGQVTIKALHKKADGTFWNGGVAGTFPSYAFLPTGRFSAYPLLSWFKDRTTGAVQATGLLSVSTGSSATVADGTTIVAGAITYTAKTTLGTSPVVPYQVLIGSTSTATAFLTNLKAAMLGTAGAGTTYSVGTLPHPAIQAAALTTSSTWSLAVNAYIYGTSGNSFATTASGVIAAWGATTLTGGTDAQASTNATAYSASGPSDAGWYQLLTSVGVRITPRATLKAEANAQYGTIGNYTVTDTGADVEFIPINLTDYAWNQLVNTVIGSSLCKGDVVVTANGGSGLNFKAVLSQAMFAGGSRAFSASTLSQGGVKLSSTLCQSGGILVPQLALSLS